jgi:hypothetical protein
MNHHENEGKSQKNQSPTKEFVQSSRFLHGSGSQNKKISWYIVTMVIDNYMSLSIVEDQIFKTLLSRHEL